MKDARVIYKKTGTAKFTSHLDIMRLMTRIIRKADIPVWYTEGFNPHAYFNFALPLSLGVESEYEIMDMRIIDDNMDLSEIKERLKSAFPVDFEAVDVYTPSLKFSAIASAGYNVNFYNSDNEFYKVLQEFFSKTEILCQKKNKKMQIVTFNAAPKIISKDISLIGDTAVLKLVVPAGNNDNLNPSLIINAFLSEMGDKIINYDIIRTGIFTEDLELFK